VKAITLTQPWATLVALGAKRFETRSWRPRHLGPIAIHAARSVPGWVEDVAARPVFRRHLGSRTLASLPRGQVIAVADLLWAESTDSVELPELLTRLGGPDEWEFGDYSPGRWAWFLAGVTPLPEPVPARGALGLWEWTPPNESELSGVEVPRAARRGGAR
jgi:hypothetical protein